MRGSLSDMACQIALLHHERADSRGYWGIDGGKLPEYIKIVTLADVCSALVSKRAYKPAWPLCRVTGYIQDNSGSQFDPRLVELFIPLVQDIFHSKNDKRGQYAF